MIRFSNKFNSLRLLNQHLVVYPTPINLNYFWGWGSLAGFVLVGQIITGVLLAMHYVPHVDYAFASVQHLMTDVPSGMLLRYAHANGASLFFIVVYMHIFRGIYYSSGNQPREIVWISGVVILLVMIITAFIGFLKNGRIWLNIVIFVYCLLMVHCATVLFLKQQDGRVAGLVSNNGFDTWLECKGGPNGLSAASKQIGTEKPLKTRTVENIFLNLPVKPQVVWEDSSQCRAHLSKYKGRAGIYIWINLLTEDFYVGSAKCLSYRLNRYYYPKELEKDLVIYRAIKKYGHNMFALCLLEICGDTKKILKKDLLDREQWFLDTLKPTYNVLKFADSSMGFKHTEETKLIMRANYSDARRDFARNINLGKTLSEEHRLLLSVAGTARFQDEQARALQREAAQNKKAVVVKNLDGTVYKTFASKKHMATYFNCCTKTINKCLMNNTLFRKKFILSLDLSVRNVY